MDLDGFEPSTSSSHLRNINHLQTFPRKTKDLEEVDLDAGGRQRAVFGRLDSTWTPHGELARGEL